nr:hypothetical protein Iba_chr08cCG14510 [Ipomoea batatas]
MLDTFEDGKVELKWGIGRLKLASKAILANRIDITLQEFLTNGLLAVVMIWQYDSLSKERAFRGRRCQIVVNCSCDDMAVRLTFKRERSEDVDNRVQHGGTQMNHHAK